MKEEKGELNRFTYWEDENTRHGRSGVVIRGTHALVRSAKVWGRSG